MSECEKYTGSATTHVVDFPPTESGPQPLEAGSRCRCGEFEAPEGIEPQEVTVASFPLWSFPKN